MLLIGSCEPWSLRVLFGEVMEPSGGVLLEEMLLSTTGFKVL